MRGRPGVRGKLVVLIAVPLLAALGLAIPLVIGAMDKADRVARTAGTVELATGVCDVVQELQQERMLAIGYLLGQVDRSRLLLRAADTDDAAATIRAQYSDRIPPLVAAALDEVKELRLLREAVINRATNFDKILTDYSAMVAGLLTSLRLGRDVDLSTTTGRQVIALDAVLRTGEVMSSSAALLIPLAASKDPRVLSVAAQRLTDLQESASRMLQDASPEQNQLYLTVQEAFNNWVGADFFTALNTDPQQAFAGLSVERLFAAHDSFTGVHRSVERSIVTDVNTKVAGERRRATLTAYGVTGLSVLVLLLAVVLSVSVARAITRSTSRLTNSEDRVSESGLLTGARGRPIATGLVGVAAALAGPRLASGRADWLADLAGTPEEGRPLGFATQWRYARGVLWAAIRMRVNDFTRWAGHCLDWLLSTDVRVFNLTVLTVVLAAAKLAADSGLIEIIRNAENLGALGAILWVTASALRRVRGVKATPRKSRPSRSP